LEAGHLQLAFWWVDIFYSIIVYKESQRNVLKKERDLNEITYTVSSVYNSLVIHLTQPVGKIDHLAGLSLTQVLGFSIKPILLGQLNE